ncbi:type II toxin-antitoxin system PemK/MazF family toxin [Hydrogenimonas sp. SS33]|uniref:type II toxin-antitoxin system PemK/MazF family toxin n=1 Tax=Hydrogenimonas leucolamina TaxID=2954236 RepID=UPI00336BD80F
MIFERGGIYLAKLYPIRGHEVGKTRPVLVLQSDILNRVGHTTVIVVPLTTQCIDDAFPLRYRIEPRDRLQKRSDVLCDQIRAIDHRRMQPESLTKLREEEIWQIEEQIKLILDFR